jgi:hypothetical protein
MKTEQYDSVGLKWNISIPETVEEYNTLGKRPDACLEDAIDHTVYHDTLGDIRYEFAEGVAKALATTLPDKADEFKRKKKDTGTTDDEGNPVLKEENDGVFLNRILALSGKSASDFPEVKTAVEAKVKFDPSVRERKAGAPKTTPKSALNAAGEIITLHGKTINGKIVDAARIAKTLAELNPDTLTPTFGDNGLPTQESLGKLIAANEARKRAATKLSSVYLSTDSVG